MRQRIDDIFTKMAWAPQRENIQFSTEDFRQMDSSAMENVRQSVMENFRHQNFRQKIFDTIFSCRKYSTTHKAKFENVPSHCRKHSND